MADLNFTTKPNPPPATLVNLGAVTVVGLAHAGMGNTTPTPVTFNYSQIQAQTPQTVTTTNFASSLTSSLLGNLALNVNVGPLGIPVSGIGATVASLLASDTSSMGLTT